MYPVFEAFLFCVACAFIGGCGGAPPLSDSLPSGLGPDAIAAALEGEWISVRYATELEPAPRQNISFVLAPDASRHGTFTRQGGGRGFWKILESKPEADGTYKGRIEIFDDRDGPLGDIANSFSGVRREFSSLSTNRFIETVKTGDSYEWTRIRERNPADDARTPTGQDSTSQGSAGPSVSFASLRKYAPSYVLILLFIGLGTFLVCRPSPRGTACETR